MTLWLKSRGFETWHVFFFQGISKLWWSWLFRIMIHWKRNQVGCSYRVWVIPGYGGWRRVCRISIGGGKKLEPIILFSTEGTQASIAQRLDHLTDIHKVPNSNLDPDTTLQRLSWPLWQQRRQRQRILWPNDGTKDIYNKPCRWNECHELVTRYRDESGILYNLWGSVSYEASNEKGKAIGQFHGIQENPWDREKYEYI